jgi:hypothetical protein
MLIVWRPGKSFSARCNADVVIVRRAAQAAAGAARQLANAVFQNSRTAFRNSNVHFDASQCRIDLRAFELVCCLDDVFSQRKSQREIVEVHRRGHHHRVRTIVVDQRDGQLFSDGVVDARDAAATMTLDLPPHRAGRQRFRFLSVTWRRWHGRAIPAAAG